MKKATAIIAALGLLLSLAACAPAEHTRSFFAMDTYMELRAQAPEEVLARTEELIRSMESQLSVTLPGSDIYSLNETGSARVSARTLALCRRALEICGETDGALDITVYPALRAWGFTTGSYRVPGPEELAALSPLVDYKSVALEGGTVTLPRGAMLDLGAVAKGAAGDAAAELLRQSGVKSGLVNLGGSVTCIGSKSDGSDWRVAVRDPVGRGYAAVLSVSDVSVVTSGGYERFFEEGGITYWHILDPKTLAPARSGLISVTVVGPDATRCDGLSTALFVMGAEKAAEFWRRSGDFEMLLITREGKIIITRALAERAEYRSGYGEELEVLSRD